MSSKASFTLWALAILSAAAALICLIVIGLSGYQSHHRNIRDEYKTCMSKASNPELVRDCNSNIYP